MQKHSLFIVDDHQLFRNGLKYILNETHEFDVTGEASTGQEFLELLRFNQPDLVLLDINMPVMNGVDAARSALVSYPNLNILILSMFGDSKHYNNLIELGVKGFILKNIDSSELINAIKKIVSGGTYFSQELLLSLLKDKKGGNEIALTRREKEVLELICQGLSNHDIADKLFISQRTVERHRSELLMKTDSKNSIGLVLYAIRNKLIQL